MANDKPYVPYSFFLTDGDKLNPLWLKLRAHLELTLAVAREQNDYPAPTEVTERRRGKIEALKAIISLGEDKK
jgi:hypothetical protein